jgi:aryl-alcohol dehydrogenase-like predicted oxidoreductase
LERRKHSRRDLLEHAAGVLCATAAARCTPAGTTTAPSASTAPATNSAPPPATAANELRALGKTGALVDPVSLGGEGALRSSGRFAEAVAVIEEALRLGVRYCDTAPAYQQSQDYYGAAFRNAPDARKGIFLATKTNARDREGALRLLDDSLRRLGTDHVDLWQLHDLRDAHDLDTIFGPGGAIEAVEQARADGRVRFVGITGHHSAAILVEAMRRHPLDNVLCAVNPADRARAPFLDTVVAEARQRGIGVVGMKVMAAGRLLEDGAARPHELIRYAATHCDTVIIGCRTVDEVRENFGARAGFRRMDAVELAALEARIAPSAERYDFFKA